MSFNGSRVRRRPNPVTRAAFRRQVRLEVYLPLGIAFLLVVVLAGVAMATSLGTASSWADTFVVLLAVPLAVLLVLMLVALGAVGFGLIRLIQELPPYTAAAQEGVWEASRVVREVSDSAARAAMVPSAVADAVAEAGRAVRSIFQRTGDAE